MSDNNRDDRFRDISEVIKKLMEQTMAGQETPLTFSVNFIISSGMPEKPQQKIVEPEAETCLIHEKAYFVLEMPGVSEENIVLELDGSELVITGQTEESVYSKKIDLPPVKTESMQYRCKNGVLEISFDTKPDEERDSEFEDEDSMQDLK